MAFDVPGEKNKHTTDMWWKMAAHFSHKASKAIIIRALQQFEMQKVCKHWVSRQLTEENWKSHMALNFLTQYEKDENDLLEWIITSDESWINFY